MIADINSYCDSCYIYKISKPNNQKLFGLLHLLLVLSRLWESISIDFVEPFPESKSCLGPFNMICTVICLLTSIVHIIPSKQMYRVREIAEIVFENVYKLYGLLNYIVSDWDSLFTSTFWKRLHNLIGIKLKLSSAYYPQTNGSTERMNRTITQMLRQCISPKQKDWIYKLLMIEYAINTAQLETIGYAPFFLNYKQMPWNLL